MKLIKNQGFPRTENPDSVILLLEVSVEKTLKAAAVASLVASHFMYGIVDMAKPAFAEKLRTTRV